MGSRKHLLGLQPLDSWHVSPPSLKRGALRDRNQHGASLPISEAKMRASPQYRAAIHATIWSFVVTFLFALFVVLPWKGQQATLDFFTGCAGMSHSCNLRHSPAHTLQALLPRGHS